MHKVDAKGGERRLPGRGTEGVWGGGLWLVAPPWSVPPPVPSTPGRVAFVWPQPIRAGTNAPQHSVLGGVEYSREQQGGSPPSPPILASSYLGCPQGAPPGPVAPIY